MTSPLRELKKKGRVSTEAEREYIRWLGGSDRCKPLSVRLREVVIREELAS